MTKERGVRDDLPEVQREAAVATPQVGGLQMACDTGAIDGVLSEAGGQLAAVVTQNKTDGDGDVENVEVEGFCFVLKPDTDLVLADTLARGLAAHLMEVGLMSGQGMFLLRKDDGAPVINIVDHNDAMRIAAEKYLAAKGVDFEFVEESPAATKEAAAEESEGVDFIICTELEDDAIGPIGYALYDTLESQVGGEIRIETEMDRETGLYTFNVVGIDESGVQIVEEFFSINGLEFVRPSEIADGQNDANEEALVGGGNGVGEGIVNESAYEAYLAAVRIRSHVPVAIKLASLLPKVHARPQAALHLHTFGGSFPITSVGDLYGKQGGQGDDSDVDDLPYNSTRIEAE